MKSWILKRFYAIERFSRNNIWYRNTNRISGVILDKVEFSWGVLLISSPFSKILSLIFLNQLSSFHCFIHKQSWLLLIFPKGAQETGSDFDPISVTMDSVSRWKVWLFLLAGAACQREEELTWLPYNYIASFSSRDVGFSRSWKLEFSQALQTNTGTSHLKQYFISSSNSLHCK